MELTRTVLIFVLAAAVTRLVPASPHARRVYHQIMKKNNYNKHIRPSGKNGRLTVKLGMRLSQLRLVDEKNQIMTTSVWLRHEWYDNRLTWDPAENGQVKMLHIPSEDLWRPDILLYSNADGEFVITLLTKATVYWNGRIVWEPPATYKSYCPIDVEFFPFDIQCCAMKFGSWTYDGNQMDLVHFCNDQGRTNKVGDVIIDYGVDLRDFYQNVEWDIIGVEAVRHMKQYPCCPAPYIDITFKITLRRRTLFYTLNLIAPCLSISCLTVLVFYLPSDSGEKITLSISILLALTVFFLLLSDINPPTSLVVPLIGKYLLFTMIMVTLSIFLTVYTLNINYRKPSTHQMSPSVKYVFTEILPRFLLMRRPEITKQVQVSVRTCNGIEMREMVIDSSKDSYTYENLRNRHPTEELNPGKITNPSLDQYPEVQEALTGVRYIADQMKSSDSDISERRDWRYIAMVMDRLFLYIFTIACVTGALSVFLSAPSLYNPQPIIDKHTVTDINCTY